MLSNLRSLRIVAGFIRDQFMVMTDLTGVADRRHYIDNTESIYNGVSAAEFGDCHLPAKQQLPVLIDSETVLLRGTEALAQIDPVLARLVDGGAKPDLRWSVPGFAGLCWIVTGQQLSTASASAIWKRVQASLGEVTPETVHETSDERFRELGMSRGKIKTLRSAADAVLSGDLPLSDLHAREAEEAHALMTAVHGIGPWTADLYLMFCIGHGDIFPSADLALQEAAKIAYGLETRPSVKVMNGMAQGWKPWRAVAARILWSYYRQVKSREGLLLG